MKALSIIAIAIAAFLVFLGVSSRSGAGAVLSNAVIIGGLLIAAVVAGSWIAMFVKNRQQ
jgi:hypothetical protein